MGKRQKGGIVAGEEYRKQMKLWFQREQAKRRKQLRKIFLASLQRTKAKYTNKIRNKLQQRGSSAVYYKPPRNSLGYSRWLFDRDPHPYIVVPKKRRKR